MKNYVGVEIVKAEPSNRKDREGYRVVYPNGAVSWIPKEVFESGYRELDCEEFIMSEES